MLGVSKLLVCYQFIFCGDFKEIILLRYCCVCVGLSHLAALQQFEALLAIPGIVPKMVTVSLLLRCCTFTLCW